jgi:Pyruvate/2-oxoacid:ferredoxin oxidoreductase delta subunit
LHGLSANKDQCVPALEFKRFLVADIISLNKKIQLSKEKTAEMMLRRKVLAVQKLFQCSQCAIKCEKCGTQIGAHTSDAEINRERIDIKLRVPYRFCESCSEEYIDYIERLKGNGDKDCYWRNDHWLEAWRKWTDYRSTIDSYTKSKEFLQLLHELK